MTRQIASTITHSPAETTAEGSAFVETCVMGAAVVALRGELGAGKTHFVKGIAKALGIEEDIVTSPTFSLANEYTTSRGSVSRLIHLDCYRFEKPEELLQLGVEDYLHAPDALAVVEWPERIEPYLPTPRFEVTLSHISESSRTIGIEVVE